ncbi:MAG: hypothetical protein ABGX33_01825 [Cycloclasticus sp.]
MELGSISQNAVAGITRGINQADAASQRLASSEQLSGEKSVKDTAKDLIALKQAETQVQISARVAQTAGDIIGSILDVHA